MKGQALYMLSAWIMCVCLVHMQHVLSKEIFEFQPASPLNLGGYCCNTTAYNVTDRISFVNSSRYEVHIREFEQVELDPCEYIFRPSLCIKNITRTRIEHRVRTELVYKNIVREVLCDPEDIRCCEGLVPVEGRNCITEEEAEQHRQNQEEIDSLFDGIW